MIPFGALALAYALFAFTVWVALSNRFADLESPPLTLRKRIMGSLLMPVILTCCAPIIFFMIAKKAFKKSP